MSYRPSRSQADRASALALEMRTLIGRLKRTLRDQTGHEDFTPSQTSVVLRLEKDGPTTVSSLARAEAMRPQSMSAVIAELDTAGLVSGAPDPADGRRTIVSLTKAGWDAVRASRDERQDWLTHFIGAKLTPAERKQLAAAMDLIERLS